VRNATEREWGGDIDHGHKTFSEPLGLLDTGGFMQSSLARKMIGGSEQFLTAPTLISMCGKT
jgi:hypothetical protein